MLLLSLQGQNTSVNEYKTHKDLELNGVAVVRPEDSDPVLFKLSVDQSVYLWDRSNLLSRKCTRLLSGDG